MQRIDGATIGVEPLAGSESFLTVQPSGAVIAWTEGPIDDVGVPLEPVGPGVVTLSPDGSVLTVWGSGRGVQLFDRGSLAHRGELAMGAETSILGVDFSRDGRQLAVMTCPFGQEPSCEASLTVWDVAATRPVAGPVDVGPVASFLSTSVAFADADRSVVTAGDDGMAVWDADGLGRLGGPRRPSELSPVASDRVVVVSATETDGSSLVSATSDSGQTVVWAWQDSDLEVLDVVEAVPAMFLDDGTLMSGMGNGPFVARDADSLEPTGPIYRAEGGPNQYHQAGSSMLVSSAGHGGVELWDRTTGDARSGPLPFSSAAVDPEAETMYLGAAGVPGLGREVRVLSLRMDDLAEEACRRAGRNLTGSEWRSLMTADQPYRVTCPQWPDASNLG